MNVVYDALTNHLPGIKRRSVGSWSSFNAICCLYNGESRPDTRGRGGIMLTPEDGCVYHCFNCKYKAAWTPGQKLGRRMESLLDWAGIGLSEMRKIKFNIWQMHENAKSANPISHTAYTKSVELKFNERALPEGAKPFSYWLDPDHFVEEFAPIVTYMMDRGMDLFNATDYYWTPKDTTAHYDISKRVIVPFRWKDKIVGFTARDVTGTAKYRYFTDAQPNYIFNTETIEDDNAYIFVCEGPFDALAINGVAMLGDKMSDEQIEWLNNTGKKIVIIPDREKMGGKIVDIAIKQGWYVTFPEWGRDLGYIEVKDSAQAVQTFGKIYTLLSIIDAMVNKANQITVRMKIFLRHKK